MLPNFVCPTIQTLWIILPSNSLIVSRKPGHPGPVISTNRWGTLLPPMARSLSTSIYSPLQHCSESFRKLLPHWHLADSLSSTHVALGVTILQEISRTINIKHTCQLRGSYDPGACLESAAHGCIVWHESIYRPCATVTMAIVETVE